MERHDRSDDQVLHIRTSLLAGAPMMTDCTTCRWIRWSASIPFILLIVAGGFAAFAHLPLAQQNATTGLLAIYLGAWAYVLGIAGLVLQSGWWFWKWHHMRTRHAVGSPWRKAS